MSTNVGARVLEPLVQMEQFVDAARLQWLTGRVDRMFELGALTLVSRAGRPGSVSVAKLTAVAGISRKHRKQQTAYVGVSGGLDGMLTQGC